MRSIYNAWYSESQAKVCGGSSTYRTLTGEEVQVSEICKGQPEGDWSDYKLVGQVNLDDDCLIAPCPIISVDQMFCNLKKYFPEAYQAHYADLHEKVVNVSRELERKLN